MAFHPRVIPVLVARDREAASRNTSRNIFVNSESECLLGQEYLKSLKFSGFTYQVDTG